MSPLPRPKTALVTGASSGIGAAAVTHLAAAGFHVVGGARRVDRVEAVTGPVGGDAFPLDVTDTESIERFVASARDAASRAGAPIALLVNNAGGALGMDSVADALDERWETMYRTNVLGSLRMTRAL